MGFGESFFPFNKLMFVGLTLFSALQKFFSFISSCLIVVDLSFIAIGFHFRKLFFVCVSMHSRLFSNFSSIIFHVSGFMLRPLVYIKFNFLQSSKYSCSCILLHEVTQLYKYHLMKKHSFIHFILLTSLSRTSSS